VTASTSTVRLFIADDHPLYREGLVRLLGEEPGFEVVGEAEDGVGAVSEMRRLAPDVAVLDLALPGMDAIAVMESLGDSTPGARVVVVSASLDSAMVFRALSAGARGYVPKSASGTEIVSAVNAVARGDVIIPPDLHAGLAGELRLRRGAAERPAVSARELEVLRLAAEGMTVNAIAGQLFVSAATVKTHLQHVYEKLGVSDRAAAVAQAMRLGLLR
jgi:two-component system nitrate/nitrite response regulator NarL